MASFRFAARFGSRMVAGLLVLLAPAAASALPFSSSVERFEGDGNAYGSAGGVFVDEFDDGVIGPNWATLLGTAIESGGKLTLRDPGLTVPLVGLPQEISTVESTAELDNGGGDFTITSYWDPTPLPVNRQFFFQLYGLNPVIEASGITVNNFDAATAAGAGAPVGWSIGRQRVFPLGNQAPPVQDYVAIDPLAITGRIVLRLSFDDATDLLTASFSLDGGTTFQSPFAPLQAFLLTPDAEILIGAAALPPGTQPPPGCAYIDGAKARFQRLGEPAGEQTVRFGGRLPLPPGYPPGFVLNPVLQGAQLTAFSGTGLGTIYDVPPGAVGSGPCGPRDGWIVRGRTFKYVNYSGVLPPTCTASANGLKQVKLKDDRDRSGRVGFSLTARDANVFGAPPGQALVGIGLGVPDGQGNFPACGAQTLSCVSSPKSVRCRF